MIKVVPKFTKADIKKAMQQRKQLMLDAITLRLQRIGETFVTNARNNGSYRDQTGNLRGSIGYVILYNGAQLSDNFEGTKDGVLFAKKAIADISSKYPSGFVFIGVAGMSYAAAVESLGYTVISNSATIAAEDLKKAFKKFQSLNT